MQYLALDDLLRLHAMVLVKDGGADGIRDIGRLESAVASQYQAVFGEELYQSLHEKSAALIRGIIGDHPFSDGNKRTAMLAGLTILELNGCRVTAESGELEDFAVSVANDHLDVDAITTWLRNHSQAIVK